jgi:hypothetical protein
LPIVRISLLPLLFFLIRLRGRFAKPSETPAKAATETADFAAKSRDTLILILPPPHLQRSAKQGRNKDNWNIHLTPATTKPPT